MKYSLKAGRIVVVTAGRYAGTKAIVVKVMDKATKGRKYEHCLVVGIAKNARKLTRKMSAKKIDRRSNMTPFIKVINAAHILPTRYVSDINFNKITVKPKKEKKEEGEAAAPAASSAPETQEISLDEQSYKDPATRSLARRGIAAILKKEFNNQVERKNEKAAEGTQYFYKKLRF